MFQGMFRKRGRPPEQLPIGGYDRLNDEETGQIPDHQSLEAPRLSGNLNKMLLCNQVLIRETVQVFNRFQHNMLITCQILKIDDWHLTLNRL